MSADEPIGGGNRSHGFAPISDARTRLLILGSLPGGASLAAGRYYANPRNGFWSLVGGAIGEDLVAMTYERRLAALVDAGIGLWDVVASAERPGSLDAAIRDAEPADLVRLVSGLPALQAIAFNGALAARLGRRILGEEGCLRSGVALIDLPSSSPAHARPLAEKALRWMALSVYGMASNPEAETR
ncbi:DNA-deoxyinosine glycosylase [soil metagenome]